LHATASPAPAASLTASIRQVATRVLSPLLADEVLRFRTTLGRQSSAKSPILVQWLAHWGYEPAQWLPAPLTLLLASSADSTKPLLLIHILPVLPERYHVHALLRCALRLYRERRRPLSVLLLSADSGPNFPLRTPL